MEANYPDFTPELTVEDPEIKKQDAIDTTHKLTLIWLWPLLGLIVITITIGSALAYQHFVGPLNLPFMPSTPSPMPLVTPRPPGFTVPTATPTFTSDRERDGCQVGGCSGQLCGETGEELFSTCEFRPEYACYKSAICARQSDGRCAWAPSQELTSCLNSPAPVVPVNPINLRDTQRRSDLQKLTTALYTYSIENGGGYPYDFPTTPTCIGTASGCYNLAPLLTPVYLETLPLDPDSGTAEVTGYSLYLTDSGQITAIAKSEATPLEPITFTR
jgi:eight-cysteine-cluster-containing protein